MQYRQGDVLLVRVDAEVPDNAKAVERDKGRVILAYGEVTGHAHAILEKEVSLWEVDTEGRLLVIGEEEVALVHEEHDTIKVPKGTYKVVQQREYTPQGIVNVLD